MQYFTLFILLLLAYTATPQDIKKLCLQTTVETLQDGQVIRGTGEVCYRSEDGLLVTAFTAPSRQIIFANKKGAYKMYDPEHNTIMQTQGAHYSSKTSIFYQFLHSHTSDMGLRDMGYELETTKVEDMRVITTWKSSKDRQTYTLHAKLVHENYNPVFLKFYEDQDKVRQKTYFTRYTQLAGIFIPLKVIEIHYASENDSMIVRKRYKSPRINETANDALLNYQIPEDAQILQQE